MGSRDPRVDTYIAKSADFAKPILQSLRKTVHEACPQVEETIKWGSPSFVHAGGILCGMAAFKQHASFGFWKHALVMGTDAPRDGMGSYGKITGPSELPPNRRLMADLKKAMTLNEQGIKTPGVRRRMVPRPPPQAPADLVAALNKNSRARAAFEIFPSSQKREYIEWIVEAKREPGLGAWPRPSNGSPRASRATGNTATAEQHRFMTRNRDAGLILGRDETLGFLVSCSCATKENRCSWE